MKRLESFLRRWAIPNPTAIIIAGQAFFYLLSRLGNPEVGQFDLTRIMLLPGQVLQGEVWRLVSFIFFPPATTPLFVIFFWLLMYRFGTALETVWGTYRYNLYLWIGFLAVIVAHFIVWGLGGDGAVMLAQFSVMSFSRGTIDITSFIYGTLFLAFARLFPNFTINVMFILPMQIRWLALIAWLGYGYAFLRGDISVKIFIVASLLNYFLFLGRDHLREIKQGQRRRAFQAKVEKVGKPVHTCLVCGINSETSPKTAFRYCSKCAGQCCYCPEHIQNHEHVLDEAAAES
jgi:hypothetical protein